MANSYDGFLLVNKPVGPSSFAMVNAVRRCTDVRRVGHAGTLDPLASGLLIMALGRQYTRQLDKFVTLDKTYTVQCLLGQSTTTYDAAGTITSAITGPLSAHQITEDRIKAVVSGFLGSQLQVPPAFSAKKHKGVRAYKQARQGNFIALDPVTIIIHDLMITHCDINAGLLNLTVRCSKGTYIRSLIHDIGQKLGVGAYITALHRSAIGAYTDSASLVTLTPDTIASALFTV